MLSWKNVFLQSLLPDRFRRARCLPWIRPFSAFDGVLKHLSRTPRHTTSAAHTGVHQPSSSRATSHPVTGLPIYRWTSLILLFFGESNVFFCDLHFAYFRVSSLEGTWQTRAFIQSFRNFKLQTDLFSRYIGGQPQSYKHNNSELAT